MSNNKKATEQNQQKVMTKYDLKMQRRKEQKEKEKKEKRRGTIIGVLILVAFVCLFASFPINNYMVTNGTYITVGGEKITRLEFDYRYNIVKNNYSSQYFDLSMFDLSEQMYSDTLTWEDFLKQLTVEGIIQNRAIKAQAEATGFDYDVTEGYNTFMANISAAATQAGVTESNYIKQAYGGYATAKNIADFVKEDVLVDAYYEKLETEMAPTDEEIEAYYESNKDDYDSVDYRINMIKAELPATEGSEPTEAEIEKAMADAKALADTAEATVATDGELVENITKATASAAIREWLFDGSRKAGDTTVIQDDSNNQYYVLAFEQRYKAETANEAMKTDMINASLGEYLVEITADITVEDPKGRLAYLKVQETEEALAGTTDGGNAQ